MVDPNGWEQDRDDEDDGWRVKLRYWQPRRELSAAERACQVAHPAGSAGRCNRRTVLSEAPSVWFICRRPAGHPDGCAP